MGNPRASIVVCTMREIPNSIFKDLANQTCMDFEILHAKEKGIVQAMNAALARAKGDIFIRIDDDVHLPSRWLENLMRLFSDVLIAGVTGPTFVSGSRRGFRDSIRIAEKPNWFLRWMFDNDPYAVAKIYKCGSVSYGSNYEERIPMDRLFMPCDHLEGTNWAMRTDLIRKVGGFDPKFDGVAEWFDTDVEQKIKKLGYYLVYNTDAYLYHMLGHSENFSERHAMWGRIKNWLRFHRRHSKFHPKMIIWFFMMVGYGLWPRRK